MDSEYRTIRLRGVSTHNLRAVDVAFPHHRISAVTGVSGSGKSSLAFDTLYAECQRRFLESLSPYLRQFMDKWPKPALEAAEGLLPAMAIRSVPHRPARLHQVSSAIAPGTSLG